MWISAGSWQPRENWSREATMQPVMWGELRSSLRWSSISFFLSSWSHFNVVLFHRTVAGRLDNTWKAFASGQPTNLLYLNLNKSRPTSNNFSLMRSQKIRSWIHLIRTRRTVHGACLVDPFPPEGRRLHWKCCQLVGTLKYAVCYLIIYWLAGQSLVRSNRCQVTYQCWRFDKIMFENCN